MTLPSGAELLSEFRRLRQLFDKAPGFMAATRGPDHVFELANPSYFELVGERELIGKSVKEAFPDLEGTGFVERLDKVYASGKAFTGRSTPIWLRRTAGAELEQRFLDFVFQPITDDGGKVTGLFVEGFDMTHRHAAEEALRESEERFRLIADSAPVPMWVTKLDRKRSFVNMAYAEFLGVSYDEACDYDWRARIHPEDVERVVSESLAGEATLEPFALEARYLRHDDQWRWLRSVSQPRWDSDGEHVGFIGVAHDITEAKEAEHKLREINETLEKRVAERTADLSAALDRLQSEVSERLRAEEALRQAQKMEAVGQLTGGIAHDFNNLLTPIMGGLELIAMRTTDERLKRMAAAALESARRGAKLTGQLLAFSRIQRIAIAPVPVNDIVANMKELLRHSIGTAIKMETQLAEDAGYGLCDANQLENAILNLAINARDAMPDGGTLGISTDRTATKGEPDLAPGDYVRISITDTGQGMEPEVLARATEPFFSTKPLGKGTGLGLAQVYGIARQSGGTVRISSQPGQGTIVRLLVPAVRPDQVVARSDDAELDYHADPAAEGVRILVIDDDQDVRAFLSAALEGLGYSVFEAEDGVSGLKKVNELSPDIVLLDYAMPHMNGADVARQVRQSHPHLPIIFVTGYAESGQLEAALGGEVPLLRKPFTVAQLGAAIAPHLPAEKR
nr:PAS domain S-box protein [uncultured Sphingosinicella sp.]